jgi:hypothetical protein
MICRVHLCHLILNLYARILESGGDLESHPFEVMSLLQTCTKDYYLASKSFYVYQRALFDNLSKLSQMRNKFVIQHFNPVIFCIH